jgi:hypothetical protein
MQFDEKMPNRAAQAQLTVAARRYGHGAEAGQM